MKPRCVFCGSNENLIKVEIKTLIVKLSGKCCNDCHLGFKEAWQEMENELIKLSIVSLINKMK